MSYLTQLKIVGFVRQFLQDLIRAMDIRFQFPTDLGIKHIAPDICVLTLGNRIVGIVEVKKPGPDILLQPTELLDQLLLVEGVILFWPCYCPVKCSTADDFSPPGETPSRLNEWIHGIENEDDDETVQVMELNISEEAPRLLSTC
eukprot:gene14465-19415_t